MTIQYTTNSPMIPRARLAWLGVGMLTASLATSSAQPPAPPAPVATAKATTDAVQSPELPAHFQALAELLNGAKLTGCFTLDGQPLVDLKEESYVIEKAEKLPDGDQWMLLCRIQYGSIDLKVPLALDIKWADKTPIITLDRLTIPTLGTFSARVVLQPGKYAGTWQHDDKGGHLFGRIERATP
jgi:hypothetical protein